LNLTILQTDKRKKIQVLLGVTAQTNMRICSLTKEDVF